MKDANLISFANIPVVATADVVIIGGGPAGFGAALRAARAGVSAVLIEKYDMPGGVHTVGLQGDADDSVGGIHAELIDRMEKEGIVCEFSNETHPYFAGNPIFHYGHHLPKNSPFSRKVFHPERGGILMLRMLEEAGVTAFYGARLVDLITETNDEEEVHITGAVIETVSGRGIIEGKVFIDGTGTAEVAAKAGAPFVRGGGRQPAEDIPNGPARPIPGGLLWTMSGVDYEKILNYQLLSGDWELQELIGKAQESGDLPEGFYAPRLPGANVYGNNYIGKPTLDMNPIYGKSNYIFWQNVPYDWDMHIDDCAQDHTKAISEMRKRIEIEANFFKKYIPGFEDAEITNVARYIGVRDARHPIGEYVLSFTDALNGTEFPDTTVVREAPIHYNGLGAGRVHVPYRSYLPKGVDNLLLSGASMSFDYNIIFMAMRTFAWCMLSGEIAGYAAAECIKQGVAANKLVWDRLYEG